LSASPHGSPAVLLAVGALAGLAAGLLGIGGGLLVVPILGAWLAVPLKRAVGTSLLTVLATSTVSVVTESAVAPENLRWLEALSLAAGATLGAVLGAKVVARTPPRTLARLMAIVLVVAALRMAGLLDLRADADPSRAEPLHGLALVAAHGLTGVGAGLVATMFGVGGGILAVPLLALLHPGWAFQACRATSLVMIIPTSIAGIVLHLRLEHVDLRIARRLVPGSIVGAVGGVLLANALPGRPLELLFAALLVVSAVQLLRKSERAVTSGAAMDKMPASETRRDSRLDGGDRPEP